jgi:uncharacterized protein YdiU (UPF0061 family)
VIDAARYRPDPRWLELGEGFADPVEPAPFPERRLRFRNQPWAARLGLGGLSDDAWVDHFARFEPLPENLPEPLACRYHGHQFQHYNPDLGDGRGFLHAQLRDPADARLLDLGTKGSGQTPYSRGADGRLTLKGAVREVLATEMLEAYGVHTSKTFSVFETGEKLIRSDEPSPTRSAVLVRLSHSHLRFGNFQRQHYQRRPDRVLELIRYACAHYFPDLLDEDPRQLPGAFLARVTRRAARFAAEITAAGFVHGVLNTDNTNVTGESFDYGPYRFLPRYDPRFTAAYFDRAGLYAYGKQAEAVRWNVLRLADVLDVVCPVLCDRARFAPAVAGYMDEFRRVIRERLCAQLGLVPRGAAADTALAIALTEFLVEGQLEYPRLFFDWYGGLASRDRARCGAAGAAYRGPTWEKVEAHLEAYEPAPGVDLSHPYFRSPHPCSMLIDEVEAIWEPIDRDDDWSRFEAKVEAIRRMGEALGHPAASGY